MKDLDKRSTVWTTHLIIMTYTLRVYAYASKGKFLYITVKLHSSLQFLFTVTPFISRHIDILSWLVLYSGNIVYLKYFAKLLYNGSSVALWSFEIKYAHFSIIRNIPLNCLCQIFRIQIKICGYNLGDAI